MKENKFSAIQISTKRNKDVETAELVNSKVGDHDVGWQSNSRRSREKFSVGYILSMMVPPKILRLERFFERRDSSLNSTSESLRTTNTPEVVTSVISESQRETERQRILDDQIRDYLVLAMNPEALE